MENNTKKLSLQREREREEGLLKKASEITRED